MVSCLLDSPVMPAKKKDEVEQIGLRLKKANMMRLRQYANAHPFHPSLTQLVDAAIAEWLDVHESEVADKPPRMPRSNK